ncbi:MAG: efflux RND transporter periplasmic adaptor subunit [Rhodopseudomonas sp.]|nr:efflux RND transporter periplasmic adaptor subunit [Rhodopseudomonas sp.]
MMTATAVMGDVEESVLATGTLKPARLVAVGSQASGRITALNVTLGQTVKKGDLIATIDSMTQQNALRTAQAALANVKAQRQEKEATLAYAETARGRQQRTLAVNASSHSDFDSADATVKTTQAQIAQLDAQIVEAEVAVETARVNLGYTRITAPIDGTVLATVTQEGQTVNATQSAPTIVILGAVDVMTVKAEISEADVVKVKPGQPVYFTILGDPDHPYRTTLTSIEPAPESIRNDTSISSSTSTTSSSSSSSSTSTSAIYYNGVFNVPNPDGRLRTYMTAQVRVVLGEARNVLTIPVAALGARGQDGSYAVKVVGSDGAIATRQVRIGLDDKITAQVLSGLTQGERVVTGEKTSATTTSSRVPGGPPPMGF